ncbi:MAG: PfkB family carbohydrate kinase [Candidatus Limnocylindrales bacterium]
MTDVHLSGTVYLDMVFSHLAGVPAPGRELRTEHLGMSPGGVANVTIALQRLGLSTRLDAAFADDEHGDYLWKTLTDEGVDLSGSIRFGDWTTPLTVSLVYSDDRSMITYERPLPRPMPDVRTAGRTDTRAAFMTLGATVPDWLGWAGSDGTRVFADVGWDESEGWPEAHLAGLDRVEAFLPNAAEAMAYTRTESVEASAERLKDKVRVAVVKCGRDGSIAWRAGDPAPIREPAIDIDCIDTTGAGDVFDAAFIFGSLAGWALPEILRFGNLCAGLSVRRHGGSLSAPTWGDVAERLAAESTAPERYAFLQPHIDSMTRP